MNMKRILHAGTTYVFALLFIAAGIFHMIEPSGFIRMMSSWPCCYFYQMSGTQRQNLLSCAYIPCKLICCARGNTMPRSRMHITSLAMYKADWTADSHWLGNVHLRYGKKAETMTTIS